MMEAECGVTVTTVFTSKKVGFVRWRAEPVQSFMRPRQFVCGAYGFENGLQLWSWLDEAADPLLTVEIDFSGDVNCIQYVNRDLAAVASGNGHVCLFSHHSDDSDITLLHCWSRLHYDKVGSVACTWLSVQGDNLATVGDDGRINFIDVNAEKVVANIDQSDGCPLTRAIHISKNELLTANVRGQMKMCDIRLNQQTAVLNATNVQQTSVTALCQHPGQHHVCITGDSDGCVSVWDMRYPSLPVADIGLHAGRVTDAVFDKGSGNKVFSTCEDGSVWQWSVSAAAANISGFNSSAASALHQPDNGWLSADANKRQFTVVSLLDDAFLPLNNIDIIRQWLICGGDNSSVHIIRTTVN